MKLHGGVAQRVDNFQYPPPAGGGLIEAGLLAACGRPVAWYPPPAGGGLIEAAFPLPERIRS